MDIKSINFSPETFKSLGETLRCQICSDYFRCCVILTCSHNFCLVCIRQRLLKEGNCSICFQDFKETDLKTNKIVDDVVRHYKKLRLESHLSTSLQPSGDEATSDVEMEDCQESSIQDIHISKEQSNEAQFLVAEENEAAVKNNCNQIGDECIPNDSGIHSPSVELSETSPMKYSLRYWHENFEIPWNEMPTELIDVLKAKEKPPKSLRIQMIQTICRKVQSFDKCPDKEILSIVSMRALEQYPESLCDDPSVPPSSYTYDALTKQLVRGFENLHRKQVSNQCSTVEIDSQTNPDNEGWEDIVSDEDVLISDAKTSSLDKATPTHIDFDKPISAANGKAKTKKKLFRKSAKPRKISISSKSNLSSNWYKTFTIPWNEMPLSLLSGLKNKEKLSIEKCRIIVRIICNKIRKFDPKANRSMLKIIAKKAIEKYPNSLNGISLENKLFNRLANVSAGRCSAESFPDTSQAFVPKCNSTSSSNSLKSLGWYKKFEIPWEDMPNELKLALEQNQRLDIAFRRKMVKIICDKIRLYEIKPGMKIVDMIAKQVFKAYPNSLCDVPYVDESEYTYKSLKTQMYNCLMNHFRVKVKMVDCKDKIKNCDTLLSLSKNHETGTHITSQSASLTENDEKSKDTSLICSPTLQETNNNFNNLKSEVSSFPNYEESVKLSNEQIGLDGEYDPLTPFNDQTPPNLCSSDWEDSFVIPWHNMSDNLIQALEQKQWLYKRLRTELIREITKEMRTFVDYPGRQSVSFIARKVMDSYPESLSGKSKEKLDESDYEQFGFKIQYTIENQNRSLGIKRKGTGLKNRSELNYNSNIFNSSSFSDIETNQIKHKLRFKSLPSLSIYNDQTLKELNEFYTQRQDITNSNSIERLIKDWPLLFTIEGLLNHFKTLIKFDGLEKFRSCLAAKVNAIFHYIMSISDDSEEKISPPIFRELNSKKIQSPAFTMFLIISYFKEQQDCLFRSVKATSTKEDVEKIQDLPKTPCLINCGDSLLNGSSFMLCIDRTVVNDEIKSYEIGIVMLFAAFYIFNIPYPAEVKSTLEFTQRVLFDIDTSVTVGIKKEKILDEKAIDLIKHITNNQHMVPST